MVWFDDDWLMMIDDDWWWQCDKDDSVVWHTLAAPIGTILVWLRLDYDYDYDYIRLYWFD